MELEKSHWFGIIFGALIVLGGLAVWIFGKDFNLFLFIGGIGTTIIALPFISDLIFENKREDEINSMFLEFARSLTESVTTGTPISKSIINMSKKDYGALTPYIKKLANQINLGIPVERALETFSRDIRSPVIKRAVSLIREADKAGGEIDYILGSVSSSMAEIDKLKKERKAALYNLVVQGYIIFFIFIGIMLVMQFKILPLVGNLGTFNLMGGDLSNFEGSAVDGGVNKIAEISRYFLYLLMAQGFFTGLVIGKLAEGKIRAGVKHSFILMVIGFLISTGANVFVG